jgi:predicted anti-sigma-YlaC factor YlaD
MDSIYSALIPAAASKVRTEIAQVLENFGDSVLSLVAKSGASIRPLRPRESYTDASSVLRRLGIDVDAWPAPPAGLFVVEERTVYLRSRSPMTIAHEFGHAIDCALGGGVYFSGANPDIRRAFSEARGFITPYASSGLDEYFAESVRAYVGVNDRISNWPSVSRAKLHQIDAAIYAIIDSIFGGH